jgi:hypothetical protein
LNAKKIPGARWIVAPLYFLNEHHLYNSFFLSSFFSFFAFLLLGNTKELKDWSITKELKDWSITKELAMNRGAWKLAIHVPEP